MGGRRDKLCNAIAVSGRYAGDTDNGSFIKYSGAGGMSGKVQVYSSRLSYILI